MSLYRKVCSQVHSLLHLVAVATFQAGCDTTLKTRITTTWMPAPCTIIGLLALLSMNPTKFMLQCVYTPADKVSSHVTDSTISYTLNH